MSSAILALIIQLCTTPNMDGSAGVPNNRCIEDVSEIDARTARQVVDRIRNVRSCKYKYQNSYGYLADEQLKKYTVCIKAGK